MQSTQTIVILTTLFLLITGCSGGGGGGTTASGQDEPETVSDAPVARACDAEPELLLTDSGIEYVRTPDTCFESLPEFGYEPQYVEIDGLRQAYIRQGPEDGNVVLLLHGQPSWSYLYRKMIPVLADAGYQVIAMDHLGLGRSDKPTSIDEYTYLGHSDRLEKFIESLELRDINLFVQDWGSLIGLRVAGMNPDWFASIAVGNGALPVLPEGAVLYPPVENPEEVIDIASPYAEIPDQQPSFYDGCELVLDGDADGFGTWMEYAMKGESFKASETLEANTWFPLTEEIESAYDAPYPSRIYMAGIRKFPSIVNEVPGQTEEAMAGLMSFEKPFITIWGSNDPGNLGSCEAQQFFIQNIPGAEGQDHTRLPESSHFLQEDQGEEIARRLVAFYQSEPEPRVGFEILQTVSPQEIIVWISDEITEEEFDALELPSGWSKNQPREGEALSGSFSRSPAASDDGPLTEADWFGYTWEHNATVVATGISMDDQGLLNAASVEKHHELTFDSASIVYILISPEGEQYIRVSRDANRESDEPTLPEGWQIVELFLAEPLILTLPNPTLNIRADNEDSFQGPIAPLVEVTGVNSPGGFDPGPLALDKGLCEDPENVDLLTSSASWNDLVTAGGFNLEQVDRMLAAPTDGPFYMFNLIRFREKAEYADGRETDLTGREANALYSPTEFIQAIGAQIVFSTEVDEQIDGDDFIWESIGVVEYPCPVAFFAMLTTPAFQERAIHKDAGVEKTIILVSELEPSPLPAGFEPPESPYPATEEDPAFELIHVMDFHDIAQYEADADEPARTGAEAWDEYESNGGQAGADIGSYPTARFQVQGVFSGDDRSWDEIHINHMPSKAGFEALLDDETRQAGRYHRYAALSSNYSMITYPQLVDFPGSQGSDPTAALPVTDDGVGTICSTDLDCLGIGTCLTDGSGLGFCTRECRSGECGDPYVCCHSCSTVALQSLPFEDSACLVGDSTIDQLTASPVSCVCD